MPITPIAEDDALKPAGHGTRGLSFVSVCTAVAAVLVLGGCASRVDGPREFTIAAGDYPVAFDAARDLLRDMDFELSRIDAAAGVLATDPHFSRGMFEPWDATQTGFADEWGDALNMQARAVRISFAQGGAEPLDPGAETHASIWVTLLRNHRSGRRLDSEWVGGSTRSSDPIQAQRHGLQDLVPIRRDEALEARLADRLMRELGIESPATEAAAETDDGEPHGRRAGKHAW